MATPRNHLLTPIGVGTLRLRMAALYYTRQDCLSSIPVCNVTGPWHMFMTTGMWKSTVYTITVAMKWTQNISCLLCYSTWFLVSCLEWAGRVSNEKCSEDCCYFWIVACFCISQGMFLFSKGFLNTIVSCPNVMSVAIYKENISLHHNYSVSNPGKKANAVLTRK